MKNKPGLDKLLTRRAIRELAGVRYFARGEDYHAGGLVESLTAHGGRIVAKVEGTRTYRVKLWTEKGRLDYSCNCPVGAEGEFCKHCVAVGLEWLTKPDSGGISGKRDHERTVTLDDARDYLNGQDKSALVEMVLDQALDSDELRNQILLKAARRDKKKPRLAAFRAAILCATTPDGFVDWSGAYDFSHGISEVVNQIKEFLHEGHAAEVIELAELALVKTEEALASMDDSAGYMTPLLERLQDIHLAACKEASPEPQALARRLFRLELDADYDMFLDAAFTYRKVLGERGLAVYRELAGAEWEKVPELGPGQRDAEGHHGRFRITRVMEALAKTTGDIEALVAVKSRDLSNEYGYLEIAEIYKAAGKSDTALAWAERGLKAFPAHTDTRLIDFLAAEYHRLKRHDEAMKLVWTEFSERPCLDQFKKLKIHADKLGQWREWRERALLYLREKQAKDRREAGSSSWQKPDHSALVEIFLWEKDTEAAWNEAQAGGCHDNYWLKLARLREKPFPEDSLAVYQRYVEPFLERKDYQQAVALLRSIQTLLGRVGRGAGFPPYLAALRTAHKRRRNFLKLLDRSRLENPRPSAMNLE